MPEINVLILSTSLNPKSRSRSLCHYAANLAKERGLNVEVADVRDLGVVPFAGSPNSWDAHEHLDTLKARVSAATHVLFGVPVYNFAASASAKNVIELMREKQLGGKTVGFLCAAGGPRGYMSVLSLANSLMLDFRCWVVPRFVYAVRDDVQDGEVVGEDIRHRIGQLIDEMQQRTPPE